MDNPFVALTEKRDLEEQFQPGDVAARKMSEEQRRQKRDALYEIYTPLVYAVLDELISAYMPGVWKKGSDCTHLYCCHIQWFAGPEEVYKVNYDEHHDIRRRVEIALEQDSACNPTGFVVMNHERFTKSIHVGLSREELIRGIKEVLA